MKNMFLSLWKDEAGFIVSAELILVASIVILGMIVGLQTVRDTVITEMADVATAIGQINQSYSYGGATGHASSIAGSSFADGADFCDQATAGTNGGTACTTFNIAAPATE